jgi:putative MATE family efflux protein
MSQRSPARAVFAVAWPVAAMGLLRTGLLLTDSFWVGRLGEDALAALGASAFGWWIIATLAELPATGVHTLVAQHEGAGRRDRLAEAAGQGLWGALAVALCLLPALALLGPYLDVIGLVGPSDARPLARSFLTASLLGAGTFALNAVVGGVFRGLGHTRVALGITAVAFAVNALLDPLLIAAWGIAGAAWATAAANGVGAAIGLWVLAKRGLVPRLGPPVRDVLARIGAIGAPVSARGVAFSMVYVLLGRMIVAFGEPQLAALGVGHRVESLAYMVCVAFEVGAATMVGQHVGAGDLVGARRAADAATAWCAGLMLPIGAFLMVAAYPVFDVFTDDPDILHAGVQYLRIQVLVFVFMAMESTYGGAFAGLGRTIPPFWIVTLGTIARLPLAWLLAWPLGLGVTGIWASIALTTLGRGVASWVWWRGVLSGASRPAHPSP